MRSHLLAQARRLAASDLVNRVWRQARQVVLALLVTALVAAQARGGIQHIDGLALLVGVVAAVLVTVLRAVAGLRAGTSAPWWVQALDRAAAAAAGYALGIVGADGFDLLSADWRTVLGGAAGAALLAVTDGALDRPQRATADAGDTTVRSWI